MAQHKRAEHEGVKYTCRQCDNQATTKGCLTLHKMTLHLGVTYSCRQCDYQATPKGSFAKHKRLYMKE